MVYVDDDRSSNRTFVGRAADLEVLREHRAKTGSILTVAGTAGLGKTRLVREYLEQIAREEPETHVAFVPLAELRPDAEPLDRIVAACGMIPAGRDDRERLTRRLAKRDAETVIVLDNAEYIAGLTEIAEALSDVSGVQVIVTSREPLSSPKEVLHRLLPLSSQESAVLLQAVAVQRAVSLSDEDAALLAEALDGLPLALRLAAERTTILSPKQIYSRLRESNRVLSGGKEARHESLDLALSHSWAHLDEVERDLCMGLAAFDHPLTIETLAEVFPDIDIPTLTAQLTAKSWLEMDPDQPEQVQMLHAVRSFVREQGTQVLRLQALEGLVSWAFAHLHEGDFWWIGRVREALTVVAHLRANQRDVEAAQILEHLYWGAIHGHEVRNILSNSADLVGSICEQTDASQHHDLCARLCIGLSKLGLVYRYEYDWLVWSERAVSLATELPTKVWAISQHATLNLDFGKRSAAVDAAREGMKLLVEESVVSNVPSDMVRWLLNFSVVFHGVGDFDAAMDAIVRAQKAAAGNDTIRARVLSNRAFIEFDRAQFEECGQTLAEARDLVGGEQSPEHFLSCTSLPGILSITLGRLDAAASYLDMIAAYAEAHDNHLLEFYQLCARGFLALAQNQSPTVHWHKAYYQVAQLDDNPNATNESYLLLSLGELWDGRHAEAQHRFEVLLGSDASRLPGDPNSVLAMLRSCVRLAKAGRSREIVPPEADNPYERLVSLALDAVAARSVHQFDAGLDDFDLAELTVPGFYMFRFEQFVRAWTEVECERRRVAVLRIEREGRRFTVDGNEENLSRKGKMRRIFLHLVHAADTSPGKAIHVNELAKVAWPEQKLINDAARNRAYVNLNRLRTATAAGTLIENTNEGYRLRQPVDIQWVDKL